MKLAYGTELVLVPRVATEEMLAAFYHTTDREWDCDIDAMGRAVYASMLSAAPQPPLTSPKPSCPILCAEQLRSQKNRG